MVDVGEERPPDIVSAAVNIDRSAADCAVAAKNLNRRVVGDGSSAGNVHVDCRATLRSRADAAASVINFSNQAVGLGNVCRGDVDSGTPGNRPASVENGEEGGESGALRGEIAGEIEVNACVTADAAAA